MRYRVDGADAKTGKPRGMVVDAADEAEARAIASHRGLLVSSLRPAPLPKAPLPKAPLPKAPLPKAPLPKAPLPQAPPAPPAIGPPLLAWLASIVIFGDLFIFPEDQTLGLLVLLAALLMLIWGALLRIIDLLRHPPAPGTQNPVDAAGSPMGGAASGPKGRRRAAD